MQSVVMVFDGERLHSRDIALSLLCGNPCDRRGSGALCNGSRPPASLTGLHIESADGLDEQHFAFVEELILASA